MILNIHSFPSSCKIIIHKCVGFLNNELRLLSLWYFSSVFNKMNFMTPPHHTKIFTPLLDLWDMRPSQETRHPLLKYLAHDTDGNKENKRRK